MALAGKVFVRPRDAEDAAAIVALGGTLCSADDAPADGFELAALQIECSLPLERCVTPFWLGHQKQLPTWLEPDESISPLYRPLRSPDGIPEMKRLVICLAGFRGERRRCASGSHGQRAEALR